MTKLVLDYYPKIDSMNDMLRYKYSNSENAHKCDWYVTEMINGAHLSLYADFKTGFFQAATRKRFLEPKDTYFDFQEIMKLHKDWVMDVSKAINGPIIVYGQIIGGKYKNQSKGVKVNSVCEYAVHNDYVIHDIKTKDGFIAGHELENLSHKHVLTLAPLLYTGSLAKAWGFPENKLSALPFIYELPVKYDNEMKGIVIRPLYSMKVNNTLMIAKKLNRKYLSKNLPVVVKPTLTQTIIDIAEEMENQATKLCILDAIMIANEGFNYAELDKIAGRYTQRMIDIVNYLKYNLLTHAERSLVNKELNRLAKVKLLTIYQAGEDAA